MSFYFFLFPLSDKFAVINSDVRNSKYSAGVNSVISSESSYNWFFFISYLAAPRLSLGDWRAGILTHPSLITAKSLGASKRGCVPKLRRAKQSLTSKEFESGKFRWWITGCPTLPLFT